MNLFVKAKLSSIEGFSTNEGFLITEHGSSLKGLIMRGFQILRGPLQTGSSEHLVLASPTFFPPGTPLLEVTFFNN